MICPYCKKEAEWVDNKEIYGKRYGKSYMTWFCRKCDARVGCHQNTKEPLGTMANKELREWRVKAHNSFDYIWKEKIRSRGSVYNELNQFFGRPFHIGESDIEDCKKVINYWENKK